MTARIFEFPDPRAAARLGLVQEPAVLPAPRVSAPRPPAEVPPLARPRRDLTEPEAGLQTRILDAYFNGFRLARGHDPGSVDRDRGHVEEFLAYVGQPLWACTHADFECWAAHLGLERLLARNSQRTLQTAVATFWDYAVDEPAWQNEVAREFNTRIVRVATRSNRIIHTCDSTPTRPRKYLVAHELDALFEILERIVEVAAIEAPRQLKTFQRDRAMFYGFYAYGIRLSEGHGLNVHDFSPNPDLPELGQFGCVGVWGKGSNGSGRRYRTVPAVLPDVEPMLSWYLDEVRPKFRRKNPDETAMWLSEQGRRLCRASIAARYKLLMAACGQNTALFSPHGLRHMHVSHQACANVPTLFTSRAVGHSSQAITAQYTHLPDDYARTVAFNFVHAALAFDRGTP